MPKKNSKILLNSPTSLLMILVLLLISYNNVKIGLLALILFAVLIYCYIVCNADLTHKNNVDLEEDIKDEDTQDDTHDDI